MGADPQTWPPAPAPGSPRPQTGPGQAPCPLDGALGEGEEAWTRTGTPPLQGEA